MFLLFAGHRYYPRGGSLDFRGKFKTIDEAKQWFRHNKNEIHNSYTDVWADILDANTIESVAYGLIDESITSREQEVWFSSVNAYLDEF
jgi:hypothetical protein